MRLEIWEIKEESNNKFEIFGYIFFILVYIFHFIIEKIKE